MKLTVLGSGTSIPHPRRSSSGYWLETTGGTIMLDFSASVPLRMAQERLDWAELDAIWISHFHLDHCAGISPFLAGTKHAGIMKDRKKPLRFFGPAGTSNLIAEFNSVNNYRLLDQPFPVEIIEIEQLEKFEILPGVEAVACKTPHTDESHAIHIRDTDDKTLVYSADTGFDELIATFANGVDLFILECTFIRDKPKLKHLELAEAIYLIRKSKCKQAMLTHFYPEWDGVDFSAEVARIDPACTAIQAFDSLRIQI
ncbi:MAG: ribonuclease Z [Acidobacteria bacterium]|nr:ribonuclease Z [Acidobacteriota bacterium]